MHAVRQEQDLETSLDVRAVGAKLVAGCVWIICSVVLFSSAFTAAAFWMTPVYRASVVMTPAFGDRGSNVLGFANNALGGLASAAGLGLGPRDPETEEALAVLQSREFTEAFISRLHLMPKLFANKWNPVTGTWRVGDTNPPTPAKAYKYFDRKIRLVTRDRKTGLITLQVDWRDREEAAAWANELVRLVNEEMRSRAIAKADASIRFLVSELQATSTVDARDAISRLMEAQLKQRMLADVNPDYSFRVVDKAIAADRDDPQSLKKPVLIAAGVLLGLGVGAAFAVIFGAAPLRKRRLAPTARQSGK
jgi:uncharacterized protein involved in exopolysaccharide biosynthesis